MEKTKKQNKNNMEPTRAEQVAFMKANYPEMKNKEVYETLEMNKSYFNICEKNLSQRREFLKHITLISAAILGLSGFFIDKPIIKIYFIIKMGLILRQKFPFHTDFF